MTDILFDTSFVDDLLNILGPKEPRTPFLESLSEEDEEEMVTTIIEMSDDYVNEHILEMLDPHFHKKMCDDITAILFDQ